MSNWNVWSVTVSIIALTIILPVLAIFYSALLGDTSLWPHLFSTVLPRYINNTLALMLGVGTLSLIFGISTAWTVTRYDFPLKSIFEWALLLPAAVPAYIIAYTYTDFFEYAGPVQGVLRDLFGWENSKDYWFPNIRSMGGAVFVMASVLYPYIFLMARASFIATPLSYYQAGSVHGKNVFLHVAIPLARPSIVAGLALVLMETISDFGTVDYFALDTLTLGVFNVWLGMNSLSGAAQISCVLFIFVVVLLTLESMARKRQRFHERSSGQNVVNPLPTRGSVALACIIICALPLVFGFVIPVSVLLSFIIKGFAVIDFMAIFTTTLTSLFLAVTASTLVMLVSVVMIIVSAYKSNNFQKALTFLSSCGYAFPGTILAVGVVVFVGWLNDLIYFHISYFAGGLIILLFAYTLRFLAVGNGAIRSGITKIHPSLIDAGRTMGFNFFKIIKKIIIPLIYTNILVGGILVFVDILKELPMTLLLRPFNFETLATYVYQYASDEMLEESSLAAIIIVLTGVGPVILLNSAIKKISKRKESIIKSDLLTSGVHN
ncbi:MAG: iron ABC transporter permease [Pelagibacteraceae bacterium]|nr:iron ABC transporter permease [Pelagibacteraceae bacterium]MBO6467886.1 iron ABC transporter permease [Pelagibacteraceae bacterium]HJO14271.1 iron ABC transporter permease [Alphaproteobacteria bacterium]